MFLCQDYEENNTLLKLIIYLVVLGLSSGTWDLQFLFPHVGSFVEASGI